MFILLKRTILHDAFLEYGRSGQTYSKQAILGHLLDASESTVIWSQAFDLSSLADDGALLTYKSVHLDSDGKLSHFTLRSSIWQRTKT